MPETITLSSGEVLIVERQSGGRSVTLWALIDGEPVICVAQTRKPMWGLPGEPTIWQPSQTEINTGSTNLGQLSRLIEILTHAARLSAELDEQYKPGTEVAG
jgi:hypothetical protein